MRGALLGLALGMFSGAAFCETAEQIVEGADKLRNPDRPFRVTATLVEYKAGTPTDKNVYAVYSKIEPATKQFRVVMLYIDPPRDAGKIILLNGSNLWFYDPASKDSIRMSTQQRLIGQAAAGDVLSENLAVDYTPTLLGTEQIDDANHSRRNCWHLDLKAATDAATYNRVEYWVEQSTDNPIKAKFYSDSGRLLKILYYRNFATVTGAVRPTGAVIIDAVDSSLVTTADFGDLRFQDIPDSWFQRDYLPRLQF
jgi:hypothetical protein